MARKLIEELCIKETAIKAVLDEDGLADHIPFQI